jgi:coenzyme F420-reducing hydrogenase delta subunit
MSAARHRAVAKQHEKEAAGHERRYDPKAYRSTGVGAASTDVVDIDISHNPTEVHLDQAREHKEHARQHRDAANILERFERESCQQISKDKRVACPLLGQVLRVQAISNGVRIYLAKGVPVKAVLVHMKCHYAYGRLVARKGMDNCPLYLKNLTIRATRDHRFVEITSEEAQTVKKIQRRSKLHVSP